MIKKGKRIDEIILNIDFASLFADYAKVQLPSSFQGKSFRDNLKDTNLKGNDLKSFKFVVA